MPRWEKSRQTPARFLAISIAEVDALLTPSCILLAKDPAADRFGLG
jgi:hypothetical protein